MEEYPSVYSDSPEDIIRILRRIIDLRRDDVSEFNELFRLRSYESGFSHKTITITSNYLAGSGDLYLDCNATSGAITVTLPDDPFDGETHYISKNDASGNAVIASGNGKNINGAGTISTTTRYATHRLVYMGGSNEWRVI